MIVSIRLSSTDAELIKCFAEHNGYTVSAFLRKAVLDYIERYYIEASTLGKVGEEENYSVNSR